MNITTVVIIVTFLAALSEKFSNKPIDERKGFLKKLKLENITIILLGVILLFQLFNNFKQEKKGEIEETKSKENYERIYSTEEKVSEANKLIDSILINLKNEVEFTREEFELIEKLNEDMKKVRKNVKANLSEYKKLNENYAEQIKIEREKINNAKPDVRILFPKSTRDSSAVAYQYQLINFGQRIADSVEFYSVMILGDTTNSIIKKVTELKTNTNVQNTLSLPPGQSQNYYANSRIVSNEEVEKYGVGFLLVKYSYYDFMTNTKRELPVLTYRCNSLKEINMQYSVNVKSQVVSDIKKYFLTEKPDLYKIFFET